MRPATGLKQRAKFVIFLLHIVSRSRRRHQFGMRTIDRENLLDHRLVVAAEARGLIAPEWILDDVEQALVAVGAWPVGHVFACRITMNQVVVRDQRPCHRYRVARALADDPPNRRGTLVSARADDRDTHPALAAACLFQPASLARP